MPNFCRVCGEDISIGRWELGYKFCLPCGDEVAKKVVRCVVPVAKSNYVMVTDIELLKGLNKYANTK